MSGGRNIQLRRQAFYISGFAHADNAKDSRQRPQKMQLFNMVGLAGAVSAT